MKPSGFDYPQLLPDEISQKGLTKSFQGLTVSYHCQWVCSV